LFSSQYLLLYTSEHKYGLSSALNTSLNPNF
jgi:hypothetical protein